MHVSKSTPLVIAAMAFLGLSACTAPPEGTLIDACQDLGLKRVVCGLQAPEDIEVTSDGKHLLLSELGGMGEHPGSIKAYRVSDKKVTQLFPFTGERVLTEILEGDASCAARPQAAFSPHGSHLVQLSDGRWRYLVVNHGDREAIELFDLLIDENGEPDLTWRGCVFPADNTLVNDVVGLSNGDLVFTRMFRPDDFMGQVRGMIGFQTGDVWRWNRELGLQLLPGTEGALTNGIQIDADEEHVFINQYIDAEIQKYSLSERRVLATAAVANVDNSAWGPSGELWLASHNDDISVLRACYVNPEKSCGMHFDIVALNPETMATRTVFSHQGPPMGAATVAKYHQGEVYFGSFLGDRMMIVPYGEFKQ